MKVKTLQAFSFVAVAASSQLYAASVAGLDATTFNTLIDPAFTGGVETAYLAPASATVDGTTEFVNFINFYDINISGNSLTMTLVNNEDSQGGTALPAGKFDTYYYSFENFNIIGASLDSASPSLFDGIQVELVPSGTPINQN